MTRRVMGGIVAALILLAAGLAERGRADSLVSLPEPDYAAPSHVVQQEPLPGYVTELVYPTIGAPSIVEPGGRIEAVILLADNGDTHDWRAQIQTSADPVPQLYPLTFAGATFDAATTTYRLSLDVPPGIPEDTYDLTIASTGLPRGSDWQPNSVRVLRPTSDYTFIHIADTQIRDPNSQFPQKFDQVLYEIKLRDPAFTIFSGDLNFGADYTQEYPETWEIMRRRGVSLACAPGNHDGYAWTMPSNGPLDYDGLYLWRKTLGPEYYSFKYGPLRVVCANSFSGHSKRRNALTFMVVNAGAEMDATQLAWIEQQAQEATAANQQMLVHLHHNPSPQKSISPNVISYPWDITRVGAGNGIWNDAVSRGELNRIAGDWSAFQWFFAGHTNHDEHTIIRLAGATPHDVHYVNTTTVCNGSNSPYEGYRMVTVRNGRISSIDRPYGAAGNGLSVPFPLGGGPGVNLFADFLDPNDGVSKRVRCNAENLLPEAVDMTIKFFIAADSRGYKTNAGRIRDVAVAATGASVVYVRVNVAGASTQQVVVEPDPSGNGATPGSVSTPTRRGGGSTGGGGGGGGCAARPALGLIALPTWLAAWAGILTFLAFARRE